MADKKQLSVEEVLAACRKMDGGGAGSESPPEASAAPPAEKPAAKPAAEKPAAEKPAKPAAPAKPGQMSVADIMAAARAEKGGAAPAAEAPAAEAPAEKQSAAEKPAAAAAAKSGSVADILAAARGEKSKPAAAAKPAAEKAAAKPAAKPAAAAAKEKAPAAKDAGPKDTASILAAARKADRPGPMSKSEAAAKGRPVAPPKPALPPMPERPAYLDAQAAQPAPSDPSRRTFFGSFVGLMFGSSLAVGFSSLFVTNLLWLLGLARYMFPNILTEPPTVFKVGFPDDYAPGQVETKYVAQFGVWVVRYEYNGQSQIYALRTVCTHLGCTPNWLEAEQKFKCPCHGSGFYKDGINFEGPAPRPLERYAIALADDGQLQVDKSRKFQEELGQWKDATSYVGV